MNDICLVFLGNPGREYEKTRHNIGWMVCEQLELQLGQNIQWNAKFEGLAGSASLGNQKFFLFKPQCFMNLSGTALRKFCDFHKFSPDNLIVVHDDLELDYGELAFKFNGGSGGHNGLRSIDTHLGGSGYLRCRIGIGRPRHGDSANFVLSRFTKEEEITISLVLLVAAQALLEIIKGSKPPNSKISAFQKSNPGKKA